MKRKESMCIRRHTTNSGNEYAYGYAFDHTTNLGKCIYKVYIIDLEDGRLHILTTDFYSDKNKEIEDFIENHLERAKL